MEDSGLPEDSLPEVTLAEAIKFIIFYSLMDFIIWIKEMESVYKETGEAALNKEICRALATSFCFSASSAGRPTVSWQQVQSWFQDKQKGSQDEVKPSSSKALKLVIDISHKSIPSIEPVTSEKPKVDCTCCHDLTMTAILERRESKRPCGRFCNWITSTENRLYIGYRISELKELAFEAKSSKDSAWYDVAQFLTYRVTCAGELEVCVRYSTVDEWVNVKKAVRERSIPLEPSECHKVNVGDLVLCYREREDQAVYYDAYRYQEKFT